ncbi:MAG TPA: hypothetical protein VK386_09965, partial [Acidimicrobiales bacterium]|nr:hypothetical protein [Acidimicrobiales bacterium]
MVVTHRRPRLADTAVRYLLDVEGFAPEHVIVVVNGEGGLQDPVLEDKVRMVRLPDNQGPAGGFRRGMVEAFADPSVAWVYLCEDDMALLDLPPGRVGRVLERTAKLDVHVPVGAVAPFGRVFVPRTGHTRVFVPPRGLPGELAPVDVSVWGAALVSRAVFDTGVLPDPELFFGFEDFDFFCRLRDAGFSLLVDVRSARRTAGYQTMAGRDATLAAQRPLDVEEPWRAYYVARNFFVLARRHGHRGWLAWHLLFSLRRLQLARTRAERMAIVHGFVDGARGKLGAHPRYRRTVGERPASVPEQDASPAPGLAPSELAARTFAMVLTHNA